MQRRNKRATSSNRVTNPTSRRFKRDKEIDAGIASEREVNIVYDFVDRT